ncbi:hypothetical protein Cylst_1923 [Cylindrospermum stagnale PCC 7417]|uniref:Uncharacterized protein n=1 Tax=Cylindrospermum stagnale PCC 7417 TaxID=56107 RepID=K9WXE8_9NOST|nr:hypothetical protein [Cylindrospermum stagnale]AFZ24172.1 hypothetical protein Cylst_1923 [Cylindrospermum stagnale PCC 7417]
MYSGQHRSTKNSANSSDKPAPSQFAPRGFVVQPKAEEVAPQQEQTPESETQQEETKQDQGGLIDFSKLRPRPSPARTPRLQMKLTIGQPGDKYEQEGDQMAQDVVQQNGSTVQRVQPQEIGKKSATSLGENELMKEELEFGVHQQTQTDLVQLAPKKSDYGTFEDKKYEFIEGNKKVDFELEFTPNDKADAIKVGLTQDIKNIQGGNIQAIDPNAATKMTPEGYRIDRVSNARNPLYATLPEPTSDADKNKLAAYKTTDFWGQHAEKGDSGWTKAILKDKPTVDGGNNSSKEFETTALAIDGKQKDTYYGSVKWGWKKDASGKVSLVDFDIVSMGKPSKNFIAAAKKWNAGKTRGTLVPKADGTKVYDGSLKEKFTIDTKTEAIQKQTAAANNIIYVSIEVISEGTNK